MKDIAIVYVVNVYIKKWEEIPINIKTLSYYQFKKQYKRIVLNSQTNYHSCHGT